MRWLLFAALSAFSASLVAIFGKVGMQGIDSTLATTLRAGVMFFFLLCVVGARGMFSSFPAISQRSLLFIILSGLAGALSWLAYFFALKYGPASKVAVVDKLSVVFVIVIAALFLGEQFTWRSFAGILFLALGVFFVAV